MSTAYLGALEQTPRSHFAYTQHAFDCACRGKFATDKERIVSFNLVCILQYQKLKDRTRKHSPSSRNLYLHTPARYESARLLQLRKLLPPLRRNLLLAKLARLAPQILRALLDAHLHLHITDGDQAACEVHVVFGQQAKRDHEVVDVVEDEGLLVGVGGFLGEEGRGVVAPVAERVEVVRRVVAVVEAVAVAGDVDDGDAGAEV